MTSLGEALRVLSPQRDAQFRLSAAVRGGVVPDGRTQFATRKDARPAPAWDPEAGSFSPPPPARNPDLTEGLAAELTEAERYAMEQCADGREYDDECSFIYGGRK